MKQEDNTNTTNSSGFLTAFENALKKMASLKITVWLFAYAMFLVMIGTLAQRESGIWTVVDDIFRSYGCKFQLRWMFPEAWVGKGSILAFLKDWYVPDELGFMRQLGIIPPMEEH